MTGTSTLEKEETRTKPKPPICHVYCARCFVKIDPPVALCGRPRPKGATLRTTPRPADADICVVCQGLRSTGEHRCRTCGGRILPPRR